MKISLPNKQTIDEDHWKIWLSEVLQRSDFSLEIDISIAFDWRISSSAQLLRFGWSWNRKCDEMLHPVQITGFGGAEGQTIIDLLEAQAHTGAFQLMPQHQFQPEGISWYIHLAPTMFHLSQRKMWKMCESFYWMFWIRCLRGCLCGVLC